MKKYLFLLAFVAAFFATQTTFAQSLNSGTMEGNYAAQLYADSVKAANTVHGRVKFNYDPWVLPTQVINAAGDTLPLTEVGAGFVLNGDTLRGGTGAYAKCFSTLLFTDTALLMTMTYPETGKTVVVENFSGTVPSPWHLNKIVEYVSAPQLPEGYAIGGNVNAAIAFDEGLVYAAFWDEEELETAPMYVLYVPGRNIGVFFDTRKK